MNIKELMDRLPVVQVEREGKESPHFYSKGFWPVVEKAEVEWTDFVGANRHSLLYVAGTNPEARLLVGNVHAHDYSREKTLEIGEKIIPIPLEKIHNYRILINKD